MNADKLAEAKQHLLTVRNYIVNGEIAGAITDACNAIDAALKPHEPKFMRYGNDGGSFIVKVGSYDKGTGVIVWSNHTRRKVGDDLSGRSPWNWNDCERQDRWTEVDALPEPESIGVLTMDEWQVVIDGGYLCEFRRSMMESTASTSGFPEWLEQKCKLGKVSPDSSGSDFYAKGVGWIANCRPYRAVGHVQPYFDNDECREYLEGLSDDALVIRYSKDWMPRGMRTQWCKKPMYMHELPKKWEGINKFIVLSNGNKA